VPRRHLLYDNRKTTRDQVENDARSLNVGDDRLTSFMALIDQQHAAWTALTAKALDSRADYYIAFDKCVALGPRRRRDLGDCCPARLLSLIDVSLVAAPSNPRARVLRGLQPSAMSKYV
jgi:hypothetical protein